jgi:hypothetical protein
MKLDTRTPTQVWLDPIGAMRIIIAGAALQA